MEKEDNSGYEICIHVNSIGQDLSFGKMINTSNQYYDKGKVEDNSTHK